MMSQRFPVVEQGTPKLMSRTSFKFEIRSYKTQEDTQVKKQDLNVFHKKIKSHTPALKQIVGNRKIAPKTLYNSLVNPDITIKELNIDWEQKYIGKEQECLELNNKINELNKKIEVLEHNILCLRISFNNLQEEKKSEDVLSLKKKFIQLENEFTEHLQKLENNLTKTQEQNYQLLEKHSKFEKKAKELSQQTIHLHQQLLCKYCNKLVQDAVTIIPCAHTYCVNCQKGYQKQCYLCGEDSKIEAIYYNQFMVEIVKMYDTFTEILKMFLN